MTQYSVQWFGHSNFMIGANDFHVLIDPFFNGNPACKASWRDIAPPNLVLVTHDHGDHVGDAIEICGHFGAKLGCVVGTGEALIARGLPKPLLLNGIGFNIGGTIAFGGAEITMTQAFHSSDSGVPVGYIVEMPGGLTWYHAGDTGIFSSMALFSQLHSIDLALLPIGGVFTMGPEQAAQACRLLCCKSVIPMHWGTVPVLEQNTERFKNHVANLAQDCRVEALRPGEMRTIDFP